MWKWIKRILTGLLVSVVLAVVVIWTWGQFIVGEKFQAEERTVLLSSRPDVIAEGERLAQLFGCHTACHGADMEGELWLETPVLDRLVAPNLTELVDRYSTAEFEAVVRQGIRPDGTSVLGMPSASFATMTDRHLGAIMSFIRQYPKQESDLGATRPGLLMRGVLISGIHELEAPRVTMSPWNDLGSDPEREGEYLALNVCSECHGLDLEGREDFAPPLAIAKAYDSAQFERLMREGMGLGDRELGLMTEVAKGRFVHLTQDEVQALYAYLQSRP